PPQGCAFLSLPFPYRRRTRAVHSRHLGFRPKMRFASNAVEEPVRPQEDLLSSDGRRAVKDVAILDKAVLSQDSKTRTCLHHVRPRVPTDDEQLAARQDW